MSIKINKLNSEDHTSNKMTFTPANDKFSDVLKDKVSKIGPKTKEEEKIWKSAQDMESFFLSQIFTQMRKTVPKSNFFGDGKKEDLMQSMLDDEVCKNLSKGNGLGLAEMIYEQLRPKTETSKTAGIASFSSNISSDNTDKGE